MQTPRILILLLACVMPSIACSANTPFLAQQDDRGQTVEQFIIKSMSRHFTMTGDQASFILDYGSTDSNPPVYEMKGFTMKPIAQPISRADELNGIDLKFSLSVQSQVYREGKMSTRRFGEWKDGTPAPVSGFVSGFRFQRRNGLFEYEPGFGGKFVFSRGHYQMKKRN